MKSVIVFLDEIHNNYKSNNKSLNKLFIITAVIFGFLLYLQQVYNDNFSMNTHIYNNISNFVFVLLFYFLLDSINNKTYSLSESIKNIVPYKIVFLIMGYAIFIVPEYIINVILPNERFFSTPIIRVVSSFVVLVLITIFELFTVSLTLFPEKNFFVIL